MDEASRDRRRTVWEPLINDILAGVAGLFPVLYIVVSCRKSFVKEDPLQQGLKISGQEFHCPKHIFFFSFKSVISSREAHYRFLNVAPN